MYINNNLYCEYDDNLEVAHRQTDRDVFVD
jgi:hypothetical protein